MVDPPSSVFWLFGTELLRMLNILILNIRNVKSDAGNNDFLRGKFFFFFKFCLFAQGKTPTIGVNLLVKKNPLITIKLQHYHGTLLACADQERSEVTVQATCTLQKSPAAARTFINVCFVAVTRHLPERGGHFSSFASGPIKNGHRCTTEVLQCSSESLL